MESTSELYGGGALIYDTQTVQLWGRVKSMDSTANEYALFHQYTTLRNALFVAYW